jgi:hypothetical protein
MKIFIVVKDETDRDVLRSVLLTEKLANVQFVMSKDRRELSSVATTMLVTERAPLALVWDADATHPDVIQDRREWLDALVTRFALRSIPFRIIMAIPSLEAIFFVRPEILESVAGGKLSDRIILIAKYSAKDALEEFGNVCGKPLDAREIAASLGPAELDMVREHPIIKELTEFLDEAHRFTAANGRSRRPIEVATHA